MLLMPTQISRYEEICTLSEQMVAAARANDWEKLVVLEHSVAALRDALMADDDNNALSEAERESKARMIQRILEDDAEVRRHTEPWMEDLRRLLGGAAKKRQLARAYGV